MSLRFHVKIISRKQGPGNPVGRVMGGWMAMVMVMVGVMVMGLRGKR
jgi:hypothetical protein